MDTVKVADVTIKEQTRHDLGDLTGLKNSISRIGVLNPIIVEDTEDEGWVLIAGERRLRAVMELGLAEIPFVTLEDNHSLEAQIAENLHRKKLTDLEEAQAVLALSDELTVKQVTEATGIKGKQQAAMKKRAKAVDAMIDDEAYEDLNMFSEDGIDQVLTQDVSFLDSEEAQKLGRARIVQYMVHKNMAAWTARDELRKEQQRHQYEETLRPIIDELLLEKKQHLLETKEDDGHSYYYKPSPKVGPQAKVLTDKQAIEHYDESCFAWWYNEEQAVLTYYCRNWLRHADTGKSELKDESATQVATRKEENREANKAQRLEAAIEKETQRRFITERRTKKTLASWAWELMVTDLDRYGGSWEKLRKILGISPKKREHGGNDDKGAVVAYCEEVGTNLDYLVIAFQAMNEVHKQTWTSIEDERTETWKTETVEYLAIKDEVTDELKEAHSS